MRIFFFGFEGNSGEQRILNQSRYQNWDFYILPESLSEDHKLVLP